MSIIRVISWSFVLAMPLAAQWPGHAALLNYTIDINQVVLGHVGDTIHAIGVTGGLTPNFVHYARSRDGGRSFPIHDQPLAYIGGAISLFSGLMGSMSLDDDVVAAGVCVPWLGPHVLRSADGGNTWLPPVRVSMQYGSPGATRVFVHAHGPTVAAVWSEVRPVGNTWANVSVDGGATWLPSDLQLDAGALAGSNQSVLSTAVRDEIHVVINRLSTPFTAYYKRSTDGGVTWSASTQPFGGAAIEQWRSSADLLVAGTGTGAPLRVSTDAGVTWTSVSVPGFTPLQVMRSIAVHGQTILAVAQLSTALPSSLLLQVSTDAGQTWLAQPYSIGLFRGGTIEAHAGPDALFVHVAFQDNAWPLGSLIQSDDGGTSWRLVTGEAARRFLPLDAGGLVVTRTSWNSTDWRAWVAEGHTRHGTGTAGAGGIEPMLHGIGTAGLGRSVGYEVREAVGGTSVLFCWTMGALVSVPTGSSTLYLQGPVVRGAGASGSPGVPGVGVASAAVAIPNLPVFAGQRIAAQAFVLDATVPDGFVATGAIESWIY